jgi:predicted nucleic acid-binding protein
VIVLDSAAAVDYLVGDRFTAEWVEAQLDAGRWDIHAPHLVDVEVVGTVRRIAARGELPATRAADAIDTLALLTLVRYPHVQLMQRMWQLRDTVAAPDAAFVALAEALDAPLVTTDRRLARSHGHNASIVAP